MNPLSTPWSSKEQKKEEPQKQRTAYLGQKFETNADAEMAEETVSVTVRGLRGVPSGTWKVRYVSGKQLGQYLSQLKLKHTAIYAAVYDQPVMGSRRLRMSYVPTPQSHIHIGHPKSSVATGRREGYDGERYARNLGKSKHGQSAKIVEVSLKYK